MNYSNQVTNIQKGFLDIVQERWKPADFLLTQKVHCQRPIDERVEKIKKLLSEKQLPTHLIVDVVIAKFTDSYYKENTAYSVNANTRKAVWQENPELIPTKDLYVNVFFANNVQEIEWIYRSIDSPNSYERPSETIGGLYSKYGFNPRSKYLKGRTISTSLKNAYSTLINDSMARKFTFPKGKNCDLPFDLQISQFIFELEVADNFYFGIETLLESHNMMHSGNVLSAFLLAMKKYGLNNDKLMEFMYNFAQQIAKVKAGVNELNDGASIAWGNLYPKYSDRSKKENKMQNKNFNKKIGRAHV